MSLLNLHATPLAGLTVVEATPQCDGRGRFVRIFCEDELDALRPKLHFTQINLSLTFRRGCVRGMHFQRPPTTEAKMIRCVGGRVFDVAVDLRVGSPTWLHWHAVELDAESPRQIFIPEGFAHGFQALTDNAQLLYMHTSNWSREDEGTLRHDDPTLAIEWPLPAIELSERDTSAPMIDGDFEGIKA
jgi:dTDP-4-dehydrorhamnose 3,5-epimerase